MRPGLYDYCIALVTHDNSYSQFRITMATESRNKTKVSKKRTTKIEGICPSILNSSKEVEEEALMRAQIKFSREQKKKESLLANILTVFILKKKNLRNAIYNAKLLLHIIRLTQLNIT